MIVDAVLGALKSYFNIVIIIVPVLMFIEIARDLNIIAWSARLMHPVTRHLKMADEGTILVAIGMIFGLTYGAGAIIQSARDGHLDKRSMILVAVFVSTCHALIEDTFLFSALGADIALVMGVRFMVAMILTTFMGMRIAQTKPL
jgi:hypothetical protein